MSTPASKAAATLRSMSFPFVMPIGDRDLGQGWYAKRAGMLHQGLDVPVPIGTPVRAVASGIVVGSRDWGDGTGKWIVIEHDGLAEGFQSRYLHLSERLVKKGDRVKAGQVIAKSGNTGRSTGPHLHFDLQVNPKTRDEIAAVLQSGGLWGRKFRGGNMVPAELFLPVPIGGRPPLAGYIDEAYEPENRRPPGSGMPTSLRVALIGGVSLLTFGVGAFLARRRES